MNDSQAELLLQHLHSIDRSLSRLVSFQENQAQQGTQDVPPETIQKLIDLLNSFVTLIQTDATNLATSESNRAAAQASLDALTAQDAAAAALVPAAQAAIDAATAAIPPAPVDPNAPAPQARKAS